MYSRWDRFFLSWLSLYADNCIDISKLMMSMRVSAKLQGCFMACSCLFIIVWCKVYGSGFYFQESVERRGENIELSELCRLLRVPESLDSFVF